MATKSKSILISWPTWFLEQVDNRRAKNGSSRSGFLMQKLLEQFKEEDRTYIQRQTIEALASHPILGKDPRVRQALDEIKASRPRKPPVSGISPDKYIIQPQKPLITVYHKQHKKMKIYEFLPG